MKNSPHHETSHRTQYPARCLLMRATAVLVGVTCYRSVLAFSVGGVLRQGRLAAHATSAANHPRQVTPIVRLWAAHNDDNDSNKMADDDIPDENDANIHQQLQSRHDHLQVEKTRTALEEQHTQSFLKRRPRKLPYNDARRWVQANLGASTKEEYDDLVANGNLRTPYIPKQPEEYYTSTREWISWDHFLTGVFDDEQPSEIQPPSGIFD